MTIPFETTQPTLLTRQSQAQKIWLSNCRSLNRSYGEDHTVLGSNSMAGYHSRVKFPQQASAPDYVDGYNSIVYSAGSLNIQTGEGGLQTITPSRYAASNGFFRPEFLSNTSAFGLTSVFFRTSTYPILGTPLQVFDITLYVTNGGGSKAYIGMIQIPYRVSKTSVLSFQSLVSAISSAPKSTIAAPAPLWAMSQRNATLTIGSPVSTSQLGAYRNCVVIYMHTRDMAKIFPSRGWSMSIVGVI